MVSPTAMASPARTGYLSSTRGWFYSAVVVVPVLALYEVGIRVFDGLAGLPIRNTADVMLQQMAGLLGPRGQAALPFAVAVAMAALAWNERRTRAVPLRRTFVLGMLLEALVYAVVFGLAVSRVTASLLHRLDATSGIGQLPLSGQLVLSLGAGIYEEIVFRGILLGGLRWAMRLAVRQRRWLGDAVAVVAAAAIFSAYHYVGPWGDAFSASSFLFRLLFGLVFSALLVGRGFGITVLTHATYDVLVTLGLP